MPKISALPPMTTAAADDEQPIVDKSVTTTKKWTLTLLVSYLQSLLGWISNAMLADDTIKADKINWLATGADNGIWWEELGRTTLSVAGDSISVQNLPARKHLLILVDAIPSGNITASLRFNNDSGNNYAGRTTANGAADAVFTSASSISILASPSAAYIIYNVLNAQSREKMVDMESPINTGAGAGTATSRQPGTAKWANTSAQITRVDLVNTQSGDFAIGSEVVVLGHN